MRTHLAAATALALCLLTGCGDGTTSAEDPGTPTSEQSSPTGTPGPGSYPELAAEDYSYTLDIVCFCPVAGPVRVTVEDGEAVEAVTTGRGRGVEPGEPAPEFYLTTINDIIADANDPDSDEVDVVWPDGQDWPRKVAIDRDERAVDDEVTYTISDVDVSG